MQNIFVAFFAVSVGIFAQRELNKNIWPSCKDADLEDSQKKSN